MASVPVVLPRVSPVPVRRAPPVPDKLKITTLKDPNRLEPADDCPVIVWGDYKYWPFSYVDNRVAMCLVAYDSSNNVSNMWELKGARYVVRVTVNDCHKEITLVGQSSAAVTVSWNEIGKIVPIKPQYFWIVNRASHLACRAASQAIPLSDRAVNDDQLWLVDSGRQAIFPKTGIPNVCFDCKENAEYSPVILAQTDWGRTQQRWIVNDEGNLKPATTTLLASLNSPNCIRLSVPNSKERNKQLWYLKPYIPSLDLSIDQLSQVIPGESFTLSNNNQMLSSNGPGPLTCVPTDVNDSGLWLHNGDGVLLNKKNGLAITASSTSFVTASPLTGNPEQQWCLTTNGYFVCRANGRLIVGHGKAVVLSSYDALGTADQIWLLRYQQAEAPSQTGEAKRKKRSAPATGSITKLTVTARISDDFWAGTTDRISIHIGSNVGPSKGQTLFNGPSRGEVATITIDLNYMFGTPVIALDDIDFMSLWQDQGVHPIASDAWKLESIILTAKDEANNREFTNYTFQKLDVWLDNRHPDPRPVWSNPIPWGAWLNSDQKPVDLNGDTYSVCAMPYIGDLKAWRAYDPSTIDGVGEIIGMRDGRLIGMLLKPPRKSEWLRPTDDRYSYTWVFTPRGAIIYRLWDKHDPREYIRHSQLGSGNPVICAGEMQMNKVLNNYTVTDVIAMVNDASGHYKPDGGACLRYVGQKFQELGIPTDNIKWYSR